MSFTNPGYRIPRRSVAGHEGEWVKTFDPPSAVAHLLRNFCNRQTQFLHLLPELYRMLR